MKREKLSVLDDTFLEAERFAAGWIGRRWRRLIEQRAKIIEVLLIRGGFFIRIARPLSFEFCRGHLKLRRAIREGTLIETLSNEKPLLEITIGIA